MTFPMTSQWQIYLLFADVSAIFAGGKNKTLLINKIQKSLDQVSLWCNKNGFKISISKTTAVLFSKSRKSTEINLEINGKKIQHCTTAKILRVIFDKKLTWRAHIEYAANKCTQRLGLLRTVSDNKCGCSKKTLLMLYRTLIRSILDYGAVAFSSANRSRPESACVSD